MQLWKQIPKGTPLASNILLHLLLLKKVQITKFFCFCETAEDVILDQTESPPSSDPVFDTV